MWHRSSPKYLASHICRLNIWIKLKFWNILNIVEWEWLAAAGCSTPPNLTSVWSKESVCTCRGAKKASWYARPSNHTIFCGFQIWSPNQKFLWLLYQYTWHIPWSMRNPTCGKLPSTLAGQLRLAAWSPWRDFPRLWQSRPWTRRPTLRSAWNDLDNTPPQRNWSMSKAMTIQNTPPPCGEALSNLGMLDDERISISSCLGGSCPRIKCLFESHPLRFCKCCWVSGLPPILSLLLPTFEMLQDLLDAFFSHLNPIHFHPSSTISHLSLTQKNL